MPTEIGELDLNAGTMRGFRPASDANVRWLEMWLENPMPKRFASARPRAVERPAWGRRHESAAPAQSVAAGETASRIAPARRNPAPLDHRPRRLPCRKAYTSESAMSNPQPLEKADRLAIRCSLPHGPSPDAHRLDRIVGDQKPDSLPPPPKSPGPGATPAALGGPATPPRRGPNPPAPATARAGDFCSLSQARRALAASGLRDARRTRGGRCVSAAPARYVRLEHHRSR